MSKYWAVVPAAGVGKRMQADCPKQYLRLEGKPIIQHTLERLGNHPQISGVVVSLSPGDEYLQDIQLQTAKPVQVAEGGAERFHSVLNGLIHLSAYADENDWVLVHDAARPCLRADDISHMIDVLSDYDVGGLLGLPVSDTIKYCDDKGEVQRTVDRTGLWRALTPQMFRLGQLQKALTSAVESNQAVTDEASAMELAGYRPHMVEGHADNIKITRPQDLPMAEIYMQMQKG